MSRWWFLIFILGFGLVVWVNTPTKHFKFPLPETFGDAELIVSSEEEFLAALIGIMLVPAQFNNLSISRDPTSPVEFEMPATAKATQNWLRTHGLMILGSREVLISNEIIPEKQAFAPVSESLSLLFDYTLETFPKTQEYPLVTMGCHSHFPNSQTYPDSCTFFMISRQTPMHQLIKVAHSTRRQIRSVFHPFSDFQMSCFFAGAQLTDTNSTFFMNIKI